MAKRRVLVFVFAACVLAAPSILVSAFPIGDWQLSPYPVFWGAGIAVEYGGIRFFEGVDTIFMMGFDGAYENLAYFRYLDGTRYDPPREPASLSKGFGAYDDVRFNWHVGVRQGLLYDAESSKNLLELFLIYRGLFKHNIDNGSLMLISGLSDAHGILQNSLIPGIAFDTVKGNPAHNTRQGFRAETSLELAPEFLLNSLYYGRADFARYNLTLLFFITLLDVDESSPTNVFNMVFSGRTIVDYLFGGTIPAAARQRTGGTKPADGEGGVFRGVHGGRFDAYLKVLQNLDLRLNLPTLLWFMIPGVHFYVDVGLVDDLDRRILLESDRLLFSAGGGLFLNLPFIDLGMTANYFFNETQFSLTFFFGAHY